MNDDTHLTTSDTLSETDWSLGRAAFDQIAEELRPLEVENLPPYNLDAVYAAAQGVAIAHRLQPFRPRLQILPAFDIGHLDRLESYAVALRFVHHTLLNRAQRPRQIPKLAEEGYALRRMLMAYADLLVLTGVFDAKRVARLREGAGHRDLMSDLESLAMLYREQPDTFAGGAPVTEAQIHRAESLAHTMGKEFGLDRDADLSQAALMEARQKIASLLINARNQLRRGMDYLRHEQGDAASWVPSLYMSSARRRSTPEEAAEPEAAEQAGEAQAGEERVLADG